jgi:hypothetical protein
MVHYKLRNNAQADGPFTDLFVIGTSRNYNATTKVWGTDFTAAALTQDYTLFTPAAGDIMAYPAAVIYNTAALTGGAVATATALLGYATGTTGHFVAAGSVFTANQSLAPLAVADATANSMVKVFNGSSDIINLRVTTTTANVNALTSGEILVYVMLISRREHVENRAY